MKHIIKTIQTKPNKLRIALSLLIILATIVYFLGLGLFLLWALLLEGGIGPTTFGVLFLLLITVFMFFIVKVIISRINWVEATPNGIRIHYSLKFKSIVLNWNEIKGYSKSDFYYGKNPSFKSQSILFYTREKGVYEVIKMYNLGYKEFQTELRKFDIICFGKESFKTKTVSKVFSKRAYKFEDMFNDSQ